MWMFFILCKKLLRTWFYEKYKVIKKENLPSFSRRRTLRCRPHRSGWRCRRMGGFGRAQEQGSAKGWDRPKEEFLRRVCAKKVGTSDERADLSCKSPPKIMYFCTLSIRHEKRVFLTWDKISAENPVRIPSVFFWRDSDELCSCTLPIRQEKRFFFSFEEWFRSKIAHNPGMLPKSSIWIPNSQDFGFQLQP